MAPELDWHASCEYDGQTTVVTAIESAPVRRSVLTPRWTPLRHHDVQQRYLHSQARFNVVPAGRRSGKTEIAKRRMVIMALRQSRHPSARFLATAPVQQQAKRIFWEDFKLLIPRQFWAGKPSESELILPLINGSRIQVAGLDVPARIEGPPIDHALLDEIGNMKSDVWSAHVRPALADREGSADFIGVPEGRNHYWELKCYADSAPDWNVFTWFSSEILPAAEIEAMRREMDARTFQQECEAAFVNFQGLAYYAWSDANRQYELPYYTDAPLILMFDFNKAPGVAAAAQEFEAGFGGPQFTGIIAPEIYVKEKSNTPLICEKILQAFGTHKGLVKCYGDASGGAGVTSSVAGSDWDLVRAALKPTFGDRLTINVPSSNPRQRARVNSVNSRLCNSAAEIRMRIDKRNIEIIKDFEGTQADPSGNIDKKDIRFSHFTDAIGYYVHQKFPLGRIPALVTAT